MNPEPVLEGLRAVVVTEIARQLKSGVHSSSEAASEERETADMLVRTALADGRFGELYSSTFKTFASGASTQFVARMEATLSFVVKVDRAPGIVREAVLLRQFEQDWNLPQATRSAFPAVYAIDDVGPVFGYLMESLDDHVPLADLIARGDVTASEEVMRSAWTELLAPAYVATRQDRLVPRIVEDYFERARRRFERAHTLGLLPTGDTAIHVTTPQGTFTVADGWDGAIDRAARSLLDIAPPFGTFVHGDPNPENILARDTSSGHRGPVRLIDPKDWRIGDYLWDAAKIGHYLRVTSPTLALKPYAEAREVAGSWHLIHAHAAPTLVLGLESTVLELLDDVAGLLNDRTWRRRYDLAIAANLLGIVGPRLERSLGRAGQADRTLAHVALAEGLRLLSGF